MTMSYRTPLVTEMSLDVGLSCCTPNNPTCEYRPPPPPPQCVVGPIVIDNYNCGSGAPPVAACIVLPRISVHNIPVTAPVCL
jgi:hypothetical protein